MYGTFPAVAKAVEIPSPGLVSATMVTGHRLLTYSSVSKPVFSAGRVVASISARAEI